MAKKRKGGRRKRKISLFAAGGALAGAFFLIDAYKAGGTFKDKAFLMLTSLTGINLFSRTFNIWDARAGIAMAVGAGAAMVAAKSGVNRYLNIPFVKL